MVGFHGRAWLGLVLGLSLAGMGIGCGDDDDGTDAGGGADGGGTMVDSGGGGDGGGATDAGTHLCAPFCEQLVAADCPSTDGVGTVPECIAGCTELVGVPSCVAPLDALITCLGDSPVFVCDDGGLPSPTGCEDEFLAVFDCERTDGGVDDGGPPPPLDGGPAPDGGHEIDGGGSDDGGPAPDAA